MPQGFRVFGRVIMVICTFVGMSTATGQPCTPQWSDQFGANGFSGTQVTSICSWDPDGAGPQSLKLVAGGLFHLAGNVMASNIATWDGLSWSALGAGCDNQVNAVVAFDSDGAGPLPPSLYAGGVFSMAGGTAAPGVARWNGNSWSAVGAGPGDVAPVHVNALLVADLGLGPALYAAGYFIVDGSDRQAVAQLIGNTWVPVGPTIGANNSIRIDALAAGDVDGAGPVPHSIYAGGNFQQAAGVTVNNITRWSGSAWTALGNGTTATSPFSGRVRSLHFVESAPFGPANAGLYVGGDFTMAGAVSANRIARWNGSTWSALAGGGVEGGNWNPGVYDIQVFDDGAGPRLYGAGQFTIAGATPTLGIARWDGSTWSSVGNSPNERALALDAIDLDGPGLFVGGVFTMIGSLSSGKIARWGCPAPLPCPADTDDNGTVNVIDLLNVINSWGASPPSPPACDADTNGDGAVNVIDLLAVINGWGRCP